MTQAQTDRLIELIRDKAFRVSDTPFTLASGAVSNLFFNMKPVMLDGEGGDLIGALMFDAVSATPPDVVSGPAVGAVPLIQPFTRAARQRGVDIIGTYVDKPKDHGIAGTSIQGLVKGQTVRDRSVVVLEDVTTTGTSAIKAVEALRQAGANVTGIVGILNRDEGATELFAKEGLAYTALTHKRQFATPEQELFVPADKVAEWKAGRNR